MLERFTEILQQCLRIALVAPVLGGFVFADAVTSPSYSYDHDITALPSAPYFTEPTASSLSREISEVERTRIKQELQLTLHLVDTLESFVCQNPSTPALTSYIQALKNALSGATPTSEPTLEQLLVTSGLLANARAQLLEDAETWKLWRLVKKTEAPEWTGPVPKRFIRRGPAAPEPQVDWDAVQAQIWVDDLHASI